MGYVTLRAFDTEIEANAYILAIKDYDIYPHNHCFVFKEFGKFVVEID